MVSAIINVIGVVAGVLGIWGFSEDHIPKKAEPEKPDDPNRYITTVRVTAGLDGADSLMIPGGRPHRLMSAGGRLDSMIHYNLNGDVLGVGSSVHRIGDGAFIDFKSPSSDGSQPVTTEFRGTFDNICIATLTTTWPDDSKFGWTGDWASICGLPFYYSGIIMPNGKSPWCMWLTNNSPFPNGDPRTPPGAIKITWHDFLSKDGTFPSREDAKKLCGNSLKAYTGSFEEISLPTPYEVMEWNGGKDFDVDKRGASSHMGRSDNRLVISSRSDQNATALCEKSHSYGPDFISLEEGIYCNMETRETLPLCSSSITGDCFDVDTHSHIIGDGSYKPSIRPRNPTNVIYW
ncbi:hypothetical protein BU23DRAFT_565404 [Bimuria novae-zelandiae CBS 107.79]|uniref:Uncharacterized protein n=1 Tax=Bimuria novae-zelandiae CBS 107.79 TaxID=1447943 RepID=A0A6A5VI96_9PLEO|nr:hypothetical protein BU23DRAFT_565404 [Bimuria novae-zelandiae CBS 107.79]